MEQLRLRGDTLDWVEVEDEVIALDAERSVYLGTNSAATLLWKALVDGTTRDELVAALVAEYDIEPAAAVTDVDAFIAQLAAQGLLESS